MTFVYLIMILYSCAAVQYGADGNWPQAFYWLCALGITICVTFLIPK